MEIFQTSVVRSKEYKKSGPLYWLFAAVYITATLFVFVPDVFGLTRYDEPFWLKLSALFVYLIGLIVIMRRSFFKPVIVGELILSPDHVSININNSMTDISLKNVNKITLDYFGTAGIFTTLYGNNNYLSMQFVDSGESKEYEIIIKTNNDKKQLKRIIESIRSRGINVEVNLVGLYGLNHF